MRRRTLLIGAAAGGLLVLAVAAYGSWTYVQRPQAGGAPQQWYRTSAPQVIVPVENAGNLSGVRARLDGKDVSDQVRTTR